MRFGTRYMAEGGTGGSGAGAGTQGGDGGAAGAGSNGQGTQGGGSAWKFDEWAGKLPENDRTALTAHIEESTKGLKSALEAERTKNKTSEKQLNELLSKVEKGSEAEKQLQQMQADLKEREMQISFLTSAQSAGCTDLELALAAVKANPTKFLKRDDTPDWEALKTAHPSLFSSGSKQGTTAGAGTNGAGSGTPPNSAMNNWLRNGR